MATGVHAVAPLMATCGHEKLHICNFFRGSKRGPGAAPAKKRSYICNFFSPRAPRRAPAWNPPWDARGTHFDPALRPSTSTQHFDPALGPSTLTHPQNPISPRKFKALLVKIRIAFPRPCPDSVTFVLRFGAPRNAKTIGFATFCALGRFPTDRRSVPKKPAPAARGKKVLGV